jgi:carboxyl-terminal processing protease
MKSYLMGGMAAVALSVGAVAYANQPVFAPSSDTYEMVKLFGDVVALIQREYVVPVDSKKLIEAGIEGMLTSLDPHSNYLTAEDTKDLQERTEGAYGGLGMEVQSSDGAVKIVTPMDDSPAAKAGIQAGDFITAIDGKSIVGQRLTEQVKQMKGTPGTDVTITVYRESKNESFDLTLKREIIQVHPVKTRMEGDYGYLRLSSFLQRNTADETRTAIEKLQADFKKAKKPMKGLVLDMRNNPGGLLDQSVCVSDLFLTGGEVVSQRGRNPKNIVRYMAETSRCNAQGDILKGLPLVVLTNNGTASAAEIVSGALKDHQRASIVGLTTFGKGSVQSVVELGENRSLKLTTARYYTPSGQSIQKIGIEPDVEVAQTKDQAKFLAKNANLMSEAVYTNALDAAEGKTRQAGHLISEIPPEGFDTEKGDFQLQRALDVLSYGGDVKQALAHPRGVKLTEADLAEKPGAKFAGATKIGADKAKAEATASSSSSATSSSAASSAAKP